MFTERLPPHDLEAEEAVLGSLLIDGEAILRIAHILRPEDFYAERNRMLYEACVALFQRGEAINQVTVAHELARLDRLQEVGGPAYLSHLIATVPTSVHVEHYAGIVSRTATLRRLIQAGAEIANLGYSESPDVESVLNRAEDILMGVRGRSSLRDFVSIREVLDQYLEERSALVEPLRGQKAPLTTGYDALDELLGGLQRSDMIVLAARPSLGKSTLAINVAVNVAKLGAVVGIFSLEMSREQLALRMLASEAGVDAHRLRLGLYTDAEEQRILDAIGSLSELPIFVDDTPLQPLLEMRSKARRLHLEQGLDMLVVDYLQLVQGSRRTDNRVAEISEISRSLKILARDLDVALLAVSQLSRAVETRPSHRPQLSDLRESGSIEQDADVVMFIYRDDVYYTEEEWERLHPDRPYPKNVAEIIVAKHRHGPVGTVKLIFNDRLARFEKAPYETEAV